MLLPHLLRQAFRPFLLICMCRPASVVCFRRLSRAIAIQTICSPLKSPNTISRHRLMANVWGKVWRSSQPPQPFLLSTSPPLHPPPWKRPNRPESRDGAARRLHLFHRATVSHSSSLLPHSYAHTVLLAFMHACISLTVNIVLYHLVICINFAPKRCLLRFCAYHSLAVSRRLVFCCWHLSDFDARKADLSK